MIDQEDPLLLFFDTFSASANQGPSLGLAQFQNPIIISEIRIIPLGARVEADFPGGVRLGATIPSSFTLKVYGNDLSKKDASTFVELGSFDYKENDNIQFMVERKVAIDGLIICGMFSTLTIAVFGSIADENFIKTMTPSSTPVDELLIQHNELSSGSFSEVPLAHIENTKFTIDSVSELKELNIPEHLSEALDDVRKKLSQSQTQSQPQTHSKRNESRSSSLSSEDRREREIYLKRKESNMERMKEREREKEHRNYSRDRERERDREVRRRSRSPLRRTRSRSRSISPKRMHYSRHRSRERERDRGREREREREDASRRPIKTHHRSRSPRMSPKRVLSRSQSPARTSFIPYRRSKSKSKSRSPSSSVTMTYTKLNPKTSFTRSIHSLSPIEDEVNNERIKSPKPVVESSLAFTEEELFEPLSPVEQCESISDIAEKISDDENLDEFINETELSSKSESPVKEEEGLEEISSDEEYEEESGMAESELLMADYSDYELADYGYIATFDPFQCEFLPLQSVKDPSLSQYEIIQNGISQNEDVTDGEKNKVKQILDGLKTLEENISEKWVESIEQLANVIVKTVVADDDSDCWNHIIELVKIGLDFDKAISQPLTAFKVRHLKSGIKLLIALSQTNDSILSLVLSHQLAHQLMQLYDFAHMTLPVRLLILQAIDAISDSAVGMEHLVQVKYEWIKDDEVSHQTCYQRLLTILLSKPSTRIVVSLTSLLRKFHFFEAVQFLHTNLHETSKKEIDAIALCLNEVGLSYKNANSLLCQPVRHLPALSQYETKSAPHYSYRAIYRYFKHYKLTDCITNIINGHQTGSFTSEALECIIEILNYFCDFNHGLTFLLSKEVVSSTNNLYKALIQLCENSEHPIRNVSMKLIYRLQVVQLLDSLSAAQEQTRSLPIKETIDEPQICSILHNLYALVFGGIGRDAVVNVLLFDRNLDLILPYITPTEDKVKDALLLKSVCTAYTVELILLTVQLGESNVMSFLENYGQLLFKLSENEMFPKLHLLSNWLSPIKYAPFHISNENLFKHLMAIIQRHIDSSVDANSFVIHPEVVTTLRILQNLCLPNEDDGYACHAFESQVQLKYNYTLIQIFSCDAYANLLTLLTRVADTYLRPSHRNVSLIGLQGALVIALVKPSILLIKAMLSHLIAAKGNEFKDVSPVNVLLRTYSVMAIFPPSSMYLTFAQQIQFEIIEILLTYTELYFCATDSDEALSKSVWSKMMQQVIHHTMSSPFNFVHGLEILSEILPQPLPIPVKQAMTQDEILKTINFRKLWSAHLHLLNEDIEKMIVCFSNSTNPNVQVLIRRICVQLCDLSVPSAVNIAKCALEALCESIEDFKGEEEEQKKLKDNPRSYRVMQFVLDVSNRQPFKLAIVHAISSGLLKKEDRTNQILLKVANLLNNNKPNKDHLKTPECIKEILTFQMDKNISIGEENKESGTESLLVPIENINAYFTNRQAFTLNAMNVESEQKMNQEEEAELEEAESIKVDFIELARKYLGDFDIRSTLENACSRQQHIEPDPSKSIETVERKKIQPYISSGKGAIIQNKRMPSRGRGRGQRMNDPFRSRPPNTSRPPSMHVDDFLAMEHTDSPGMRFGGKDFMRNRATPSGGQMRQTQMGQTSAGRTAYYNNMNYDMRSSPNRSNIDRYPPREQSNQSNRSNQTWSNNRYDYRYVSYSKPSFR